MDFWLAGPSEIGSGAQSCGWRSFMDEIDARWASMAICALDVHTLSRRRQHSDIDDTPPVLAEQPDFPENRPK